MSTQNTTTNNASINENSNSTVTKTENEKKTEQLAQLKQLSPEQREILMKKLCTDVKTSDNTLALSLPEIVPDSAHQNEPFPLNDIQQAYWIGRSNGLEKGNIAIHSYMEIKCIDLDIERFNYAWQQLILRHNMLRSVVLKDGTQQVLQNVPLFSIEVYDLCDQETIIIESELAAIRQQMSHEIRDVGQWPLFDIRVTQRAAGISQLHMSFDAINIDAGSFSIIAEELLQFYENPDKQLPSLALTYRDYVNAELKLKNSTLAQRSRQYWFDRLPTLAPAPKLPLIKNARLLSNPHFVRKSHRVPTHQWQQLKQLANQMKLTPSGLLLSVYAEVLTTWSKSPQFTINVTLFNRLPLHPQINQIIGDFTSINLLEVDNANTLSFRERAQRIQEQLWKDMEHRYISGVEVIRQLGKTSGTTFGTLMPVVFTSLLGLGKSATKMNPINKLGTIEYTITQTPQVWLDHQVTEDEQGLLLHWDAIESLFPAPLLQEMFSAYCQFLDQLSTDKDSWQRLPKMASLLLGLNKTPEIFTPIDNEKVELSTQNRADKSHQNSEMLHTLFDRKALQQPQNLAIVSQQEQLTYLQLYQYSNQLARLVRNTGVKANQLVAIVMEKGWEQIVAAMAVVKSGAAYLPLDASVPKERLWFYLDNADINLVLTQSNLEKSLCWPDSVARICVDQKPWQALSNAALKSIQQPSDLAYVIYTSGSTGQPKGVMIEQRSIVNRILDVNQRFSITSQDTVLALTAIYHDLSVYDIFGMLIAGGCVVIPEEEQRLNPEHWHQQILKHNATVWNSVPAFMEMYIEHLESLSQDKKTTVNLLNTPIKTVLMAGDWIPVTLPERIRQQNSQANIISLGGPTETTVWDICYPIDKVDPDWKSIPYGKPMSNSQYYVLDHALEPKPVWVAGELFISGDGLARGYWKDAEKTQQSFIHHPETGLRLYKSGDLGRWLPDGNIEILGRTDFQIKMMGQRIECGEIEATLSQHPSIKNTTVMVKTDNKDKTQLVAYFTLNKTENSVAKFLTEPNKSIESDESTKNTAKVEFKLAEHGLRKNIENLLQIPLNKPEITDKLVQSYMARRSERHFEDSPISLADFSAFIAVCMSIHSNEMAVPKFRYPSGGGLYPVQIYIVVKPDRVSELNAGIYYYHPKKHSLVLVGDIATLDSSIHYAANKATFNDAAFSIFLFGKLDAISPIYGEVAKDFCLLEAGAISQLLMQKSIEHGLGACPIGALTKNEFSCFKLEPNCVLLHSLLLGKLVNQAKPDLEATSKTQQLTEDVRTFLSERLPHYLVPSSLIVIDKFPLTINGKINRKALLDLDLVGLSTQSRNYCLPQTEVEIKLATIIEQVLGTENIGVSQNYFELGANSIHLVQIYNQLKQELPKDMSVVDIFQYPTVSLLAKKIAQERLSDHKQTEQETMEQKMTQISQKRAKLRRVSMKNRLNRHRKGE
jgi:amino acid adenylation domain-containing protein